jgi:hypothetical protein
VAVEPDAALDARGHSAVELELCIDDGQVHRRALDISPGFPGNDLSDAQQLARFQDCMAYAPRPLPAAQVTALLHALEHLAELDDVRVLLPLLQVAA